MTGTTYSVTTVNWTKRPVPSSTAESSVNRIILGSTIIPTAASASAYSVYQLQCPLELQP